MSYHVIARRRAREGELSKIEAVLRELAPAIRKEPGNQQFVVHRLIDNPREFVLSELRVIEKFTVADF